ncbi:3-deoxy-8-phosphooctulonate synthase [Ignavibacteria bacterium CHB1]|nr:MAG: 3-deoxy-8-phosphooctulonate synthase [Chlorobiota bacterium]MBV6397939.1 2-dehydro-3-deoxyphosphooctonate aldolase [Ignavibacteria bacterium]MCC6886386.1 3-deoxy-8-phosphooctulonate synthase [Ignavibacteriales bacterium]MCE7952539.1 3-deoxy-8-phosphooctulonate synthase [Chlorobi bacterium CHB7]MDL1886653.1 3-deoxy-8-phosphooctulonate synthase [Ignavibacteria bacterium CHB1]RIK48008.1 MAG: 3-deoxy-8-phosphooctulonate synthase [Ignavibacteriota bacterium]
MKIENVLKSLGLKSTGKPLLIAGPCVVESKSVVFKTCESLVKLTTDLKIPFVFKASFIKANRTSVYSFRTIGIDESLKILSDVKESFNVPVLSDVHSEIDTEIASPVLDIIQIPAFLCRQTELLECAGETGKVVNIKKGQFLAPQDMKYQAEKVSLTGNNKILLTERGTSFGYNNLVVDMRSLVIMKRIGYPVIFDATHSVQMPSAENGVSGGNPEFINPLCRAAAAVGVDGFFIETHPNPGKALSDGSNMVKLSKLRKLLTDIMRFNQ